jgi:hypothetical protein
MDKVDEKPEGVKAGSPRMDAEKVPYNCSCGSGRLVWEHACRDANKIIDALAKRAADAEAGRDRMLEEARQNFIHWKEAEAQRDAMEKDRDSAREWAARHYSERAALAGKLKEAISCARQIRMDIDSENFDNAIENVSEIENLAPSPSPKPEPAKPRRMRGIPGLIDRHGMEHDENETCKIKPPCLPVEEQPPAPVEEGDEVTIKALRSLLEMARAWEKLDMKATAESIQGTIARLERRS